MNRPVRGAALLGPLVPFVSWLTARYIVRHRKRLLADSEPIASKYQAEFEDFFPREVLKQTRVVRASVPNPKFYSLVRLVGIKGVLEMSSIGAITLLDVIAYPEQLSRSTLFHELVHAVQYRVLGLRRFADLYVRGFLNGGGYEGIPLEGQAYELEERFSGNPKTKFSVEDDVNRRLQAWRL
jgi:hypothetical protein